MEKKKVLKIIITLSILIIVYFTLDGKIVNAIKSISRPFYIFISLLIPTFLIPIIVNNRWKVFLEIQGIQENFFSLVKINFISIFLGFLLPSSTGFDAVRIYIIEKKHKEKLGSGGAAVVIERILGFYLLSLMAIVGSFVAYYNGTGISVVYLSIIINILITLGILFLRSKFLFKSISKKLDRIKILKKISGYLNKLYSSINSFPIKSTILVTIPLILLFQLSCVFCVFLLFKSFNLQIPFFYHLAFLPLILIIAIIPVSISGFGLREGGFVFFYGLIGIDGNVAFLVSLLYYAVLMLVPATIGMIIYLFSGGAKNYQNELKS